MGHFLMYCFHATVFQVGVQHKPADWKMRTSNLVLINAVKDQVCQFSCTHLGSSHLLILFSGEVFSFCLQSDERPKYFLSFIFLLLLKIEAFCELYNDIICSRT